MVGRTWSFCSTLLNVVGEDIRCIQLEFFTDGDGGGVVQISGDGQTVCSSTSNLLS